VLAFLFPFSAAIRRGTAVKDRYTRAMIPSFLFLAVADVFMFLSSLFKGRVVFFLLGRDKVQPQ